MSYVHKQTGTLWNVNKEIKQQSSILIVMLVSLFFILVVMGLTNLYSAADNPNFFYAQIKHAYSIS